MVILGVCMKINKNLGLLFLAFVLCPIWIHAGVPRTVRMALAEEPPNLNSSKATDQVSFLILGHIMEGLLRYDKKGMLAPGVAEKWEMTDAGAAFQLRKNAKWSDGKPIQAADFVFAWRTAVDPKTASEYAFLMYPIKNAEKINRGEMKVETLGVTAVNETTLKVEFEKPCGYFLSLMPFATYMPMREDFYKTVLEKYFSDADKMIFNGPFRLTSWVHGASLKMEKNENYWNHGSIQIDVIDVPYITSDTNTRFNLFKDKKTDFVSLDAETMKDAVKNNFKIKKFSAGSIFYMEFNHRKGRVTSNKNLRKAIQYIYNPKELVDRVLGTPGNVPGYSLFPEWLPGLKETFRREYPVKPWSVNLTEAKKYLEAAKKELGVEKIPDLAFLTGESPTATKQAEYIQNLFDKKLGIKIKIDKQTFKQRLAKMTNGDFDIVTAGWGPDYSDPMTFADLFASWNQNNRGRFENAEYDKWVKVAQDTTDAKKRMDAMAKVQEIVLEELPILPQYESGEVYVVSDRLKNVVRAVVGADPNYTFATVVE